MRYSYGSYWFLKPSTRRYSQLLICLENIDIFVLFRSMLCSLLATPGIISVTGATGKSDGAYVAGGGEK